MRSSLVLIFSIIINLSLAQPRQYRFSRIDMSDGLSHNTVNDIFRDKTGFVWFATSAGLNRFDGHNIRTFRNVPGDTTSVVVDDLKRIFEGPDETLWLFTHSGNSIYDPITERFYRNTNAISNKLGVMPGVIKNIFKDKSGRFWFMHYDQGLFVYDPRVKSSVRLVSDKNLAHTISSSNLSSIDEDEEGNIWLIHHDGVFEKIDGRTLQVTEKHDSISKLFNWQICDYEIMVDRSGDLWIYSDRNIGCFYFDYSSRRLVNFSTSSQPKLTSNLINEIVEDDNGLIWIATENGGVNILDKNQFVIQYLTNKKEEPTSIAENTAHAMYKDKQGIVWIGSYKNGVSYYHPNIFRFDIYTQDSSNGLNVPFNDINAFAEDKSGNMWIGTNGGGLIYFNRKEKTYKQFLHNPTDPNSLSNNVIVSMLIDHEDVLWIGTYYGGLNRFDKGKFVHFKNDPRNSKSIGDDNIWEIFEDSENNLWLGTFRSGVDVFDRRTKQFFHYRPNELNSIHTTYVPALSEDNSGNIWIGTGYGLEVLNKNSGRFTHYLSNPSDPRGIPSNSIFAIYRDSRGWMWVASHGGLSKFEPASNDFRSFTEVDGLGHNSVLAITEDDENNLWLSTPKGLSKLIVEKEDLGKYVYKFRNYDESDGLIKGAFHENAVLKCASGELVFGGYNGFNIFHPRDIRKDTTSATVVLTDFQIFNQSVKVGATIDSDQVLSKSISYTREITLGPGNNFFSIEFTSTNFFHPEKCQYRYKLEGLNKDWLVTNSDQRRVTFTNLDPGDYLFKVKGTNSDGDWSDNETVLRINILPPFWKTNFAFILYAAIIFAALLIGRKMIVARERLKFEIQNERVSAQRLHDLDMMKIKFFTNVSHEFRTPLTLIITPLEKLLSSTRGSEDEKQLQIIQRNAKRLLNLVNQLLDFRKMEGDDVKLNLSTGDIVQFIRELVSSFANLSEKKNIRLEFQSSVESIETIFDEDKIEKVIFNLLSNAFKFTPENGSVQVSLQVESKDLANLLVITVQDTGIGIPKDKHQRIFDRFFQNELPSTVVNQGSGIGLSIASEFVKLHGGSIDVESEPGIGSTFIVKLPLANIYSEKKVSEENVMPISDYHQIGLQSNTHIKVGDKKPLILLIEDNEDFRFYLKDNLKSQYDIIEAPNGKLGVEKVISELPDLIVSDVMMPEINGIELCKKIKADARTHHIPIILLTARSSQEQRIEGFDAGANDYITKPFSFRILESRVRNLLAIKSRSQQESPKRFDIKVSEVEVPSMDEKLVSDAVKLVEENLANGDFSVEEMSRKLAMSRVQLYKKLYSLTGKTPIEFIRFIRIQRGAQLLRKSKYTVSEVAYQVGFNNPKYFAKHFKDEFNMLPSAYVSQVRDNPDANVKDGE
jgi:signal transduction histidine kinase/ligand-binding sensor domain-containing protein/DNA-binding response OmpR family regulator